MASERGDDGVLIDCDTCTVRGDACPDCVVTVMLGTPGPLAVEPDERAALDALAAAGLVPRLRMAHGGRPGQADRAGDTGPGRPGRPGRREAG